MATSVRLSRGRVDAVIFDMDGVVTETTPLHAAAWKRVFDRFLEAWADRHRTAFEPFGDEDYRRYVDGKSRYDGVASFLASRGIELPWGRPEDPPTAETVCGVGNRKNEEFNRRLAEVGAQPYATTVHLLDALRAAGIPTAVISASRNAEDVLRSAGVLDRFDAKVDGTDAAELDLPGKPDPAVFVEAARRLGVPVGRAAVVEDALAGVDAGRRGGFALVIGVDRTGHADDLLAAGADVVVPDLGEVEVGPSEAPATTIADLPAALERDDDLDERLAGRRPAVFLDYDGTLTPIVPHPADATIDDGVRAVIRRLAERCPVAVISGRDLDDVRTMVAIDGIHYAGSHGFDVLAPDGSRSEQGTAYLPALDAAETELRARLEGFPGVMVERKRFAVAVHFRNVAPDQVPTVDQAVRQVASGHADLRVTGGKMILELRPALAWDKGRALLSLLGALGLDRPDVLPIYIGDDVTDEDAFHALEGRGLGLVVRGEDDTRPTHAHLSLDSPDAVVAFLRRLADRTPPAGPA